MSISPSIILNQGNIWACAAVSMLWALKILRPNIDEQSLIIDVLADKSTHLTYQRAVKFFQKRWLIQNIVPIKYTPYIADRMPILTWASGIDWVRTWSPPYLLEFLQEVKWSHFFFIYWKWRIINSWWNKWWDEWCCYFDITQINMFKQCWRIVL